jgi:hypothetical protein
MPRLSPFGSAGLIARILKLIDALECSISHARTSVMAFMFENETVLQHAELAFQRERLHALLNIDETDETEI